MSAQNKPMSEWYSSSGLQQAQSAPLSGRKRQDKTTGRLKRPSKAIAPVPNIIGPRINMLASSRCESYTLMTGIRTRSLQGLERLNERGTERRYYTCQTKVRVCLTEEDGT